MIVNLIRSRELKREALVEIAGLLSVHSGPMIFKTLDNSIKFENDVLEWEEIFLQCNLYRANNSISDEEFIVLITSKDNWGNWFSAFDPEHKSRNIFIHTSCWTNFVNCKYIYPVAFQIIENILQYMMFDDLYETAKIAHDPPIGCINDMCSWKPDVMYKLRTADICVDCQRIIEEKQIDFKLIRQMIDILESVRPHILYISQFHSEKDGDAALPFTIGITKRKFRGANEPFRRFLFLVDHFDSIIRTTVIMVGTIILKDGFPVFFREQELHSRPSLGHWVKALGKLGRINVATDICLPDLNQSLMEVVRLSEKDNIVRARNEYRGHGYCSLQDSAYRDLAERFTVVLNSVEKTLTPILVRLKCIYIISYARTASDRFEITVQYLMGNHPDFLEEKLNLRPEDLKELPVVNQVYILTDDLDLIPLTLYVIYDNCPACGHNRVLITDGEQYLDPYIGHRTGRT